MLITVLGSPAAASHKWVQHFRDTKAYIVVVSVMHTHHLLPFSWYCTFLLFPWCIKVCYFIFRDTRQLLQFPWHIRCCYFRDLHTTLLQIPWHIEVRCCNFRDTYTYVVAISVTHTMLLFPWLIHHVVAISVTHTVGFSNFRNACNYVVVISVTHIRTFFKFPWHTLTLLPFSGHVDVSCWHWLRAVCQYYLSKTAQIFCSA